MSMYLLALLLLSTQTIANGVLNKHYGHAVLSYFEIQNSTDRYKGKLISGVEFGGFPSPIEAYKQLRKQHIELVGASYDPELAESARRALLKWLKESGHPNVKVSVSVQPVVHHEDKEVAVVFTVEE